MTMSALKKSSVPLVLFGTLIAGCGGGGGGANPPPPGPPAPITVTKNFTPSTFPGEKGTPWGITQIRTVLFASTAIPSASELYDSLEIDTTLNQNVSGALPAPGSFLTQPNQIGITPVFYTGVTPQGSSDAGCGGQVANYAVDNGGFAGRLADGNYHILNDIGQPTSTGGGPPTEAVTTASGTTVKQVVMLPEIGVFSTTVPDVRIQVGVANGLNNTDCEPQGLTVIKTNGQP